MKQLLTLTKLETKRIFLSKSIWIYGLFYLVNYLISAVFFKLYGSEFTVLTTGNGQSFPIQHLQSSYLVTGIFIGIYISEITIAERNRGTIKLILLSGVSRAIYFISRLIMMFIFSIILTFMMLVLSYLVGTLSFGWGESMIFHQLQASGLQGIMMTFTSGFTYALTYFVFGCVVLFITQFTGKLLENVIIVGILLMVGQYSELYPTFKHYSIFHQMLFFCNDILEQSFIVNASNLLVIVCYGVLFSAISYFIFRKKDLYV